MLLILQIKSLFSNDVKWWLSWKCHHRKKRLHQFFLLLSKFFTWNLTKWKLYWTCIILEVHIYSGEMLNLKLHVKDMWHHIFIWSFDLLICIWIYGTCYSLSRLMKSIILIHISDVLITIFTYHDDFMTQLLP